MGVGCPFDRDAPNGTGRPAGSPLSFRPDGGNRHSPDGWFPTTRGLLTFATTKDGEPAHTARSWSRRLDRHRAHRAARLASERYRAGRGEASEHASRQVAGGLFPAFMSSGRWN